MKTLFVFILTTVSIASYATTYTAKASGGEWTSASTWVAGVVPPVPPSGSGADVVEIPSGSVVTITNKSVYFNGIINIAGELELAGFGVSALIMDSSSLVNLVSGGEVTSSGFDTAHSIFVGSNFAYWAAPAAWGGDGDVVTGPATITESGGIAMPVEFIFFEASEKNNNVELLWATASEENFDYFSIERSVDGKDFKEIAQITGMGNSTTRVDYEYVDEFPLIGRAYYRLKSVDFDGYTEVFDYVMVECDGAKKDFTIYPNPVTNNQFSLKTNYEVTDDQSLIVYNSMGTVEKTYTVNSWLSEFNTDDLMPGSYLMKLVSSSGTIVKRILIK